MTDQGVPNNNHSNITEAISLPEPDYDNLEISFDDIVGGGVGSSSNAGTIAPSSSWSQQEQLVSLSLDDNEADDDVVNLKKKALQESEEYILGTLIVRVVAARDLPAATNSGFLSPSSASFRSRNSNRGGGGTNPYASVRFGKSTQRTSEVFDTVNPTWPRGENMYMDVAQPPPAAFGVGTETAAASESTMASPEVAATASYHHPGDPPVKQSTVSKGATHSSPPSRKGARIRPHHQLPEPPILTVAIFHAAEVGKLHRYNPTKGTALTGDSDDMFLGMCAVDLTSLLTGRERVLDSWIPLTGSSSDRAHVRIVCEYEPSDSPPAAGDKVVFTGYCSPTDVYPLHVYQDYLVEDADGDEVVIRWTSPEGWPCNFVAHRNMLICMERYQGAMDVYQDELVSLTQRLSHSPAVNALQTTLERLPDEGLLGIGTTALEGGTFLFHRWLEGGLSTAIQDIVSATNLDGQHNPSVEESLQTTDPELPAAANSDSPAAGGKLSSAKATASSGDGNNNNNALASTATSEFAEALPNMPSCPITGEPMIDPVVAADGHTYERSAIARWLQSSDKSPLTGATLPHKNLVPNYMLLSSLQEAAALASSMDSNNKNTGKETEDTKDKGESTDTTQHQGVQEVSLEDQLLD